MSCSITKIKCHSCLSTPTCNTCDDLIKGEFFTGIEIVRGNKRTLIESPFKVEYTHTSVTFSNGVKSSTVLVKNTKYGSITDLLDDLKKCLNCDPFDLQENEGCIDSSVSVLSKDAKGNKYWQALSKISGSSVEVQGRYESSASDEFISATGGSVITLPACTKCSFDKTIKRNDCTDDPICVMTSDGSLINGVLSDYFINEGRGVTTFKCISGVWHVVTDTVKKVEKEAKFSVSNTDRARIYATTSDGSDYYIDWGDGNIESVGSSEKICVDDVEEITNIAEHEYSSTYDGDIKITHPCGIDFINKITFDYGGYDFDIIDLNQLTGLRDVDINRGAVTGNLSDLKRELKRVRIAGRNTVTGDIGDLPSKISHFSIYGRNTTYGDPSDLPRTLVEYENYGANTTSGDISGYPDGMIYIRNGGQNTTSGNLSDLPRTLLIYSNYGLNTVTGDIGDLPENLEVFENKGYNTVYGNISNLPLSIIRYLNVGNNTVDQYDNTSFNENIASFTQYNYMSIAIDSAMVDQLFIRLNETMPGLRDVNIKGSYQFNPTNQVTDLSLDARNNLIANGVRIRHN